MKEKDFSEFEKIIGAKFNDINTLRQALTHRSFLNEHKNLKGKHNERLEFLGDAVLELVITHYLYDMYPDKNEGDLTSIRSALVNAQTCAEVAKKIDVNDFLLLSKGETKDVGRARQYILANALEAIIGAIYLDGGYDKAEKFVTKFIMPKLEEVIEKGLYKDAKSELQEKTQAKLKITPIYRVLSEEGPDHKKMFNVGVYLADKMVANGQGLSKQDAEVDAAKKALQEL